MRPYEPIAHALSINRRSFLTKSAYGLGSAAFAMLAAKSGFGDLHAAQFSKGALKAPHLPVKAKRVIFLCMAGTSPPRTLRQQARPQESPRSGLP